MEENETIHDRITQLVHRFGDGKNTVFAALIGSSEANVRGYRGTVMPKYDFLEKIARCFDIDLDWLLTGRGSMLPEITSFTFDDVRDLPKSDRDLSGEAAAYYRLYEKKDTEVGLLKEEIGALKAKLAQYEPAPETSKVHPKGLGSSEIVKNAHTKKHTSSSDHTFESTNLQTENL